MKTRKRNKLSSDYLGKVHVRLASVRGVVELARDSIANTGALLPEIRRAVEALDLIAMECDGISDALSGAEVQS